MEPAARASYGQYASGEYLEYQKKYRASVRESDRVIIEIVRDLAGRRRGAPVRVADVGCSSGNLLFHLKHQVPGLELWGGDAYPGIVDQCRQNPDLAGIRFEPMDLLALDRRWRLDVVIVSAVLFLFGDGDFDRAVASLAGVTEPGGHLVAFDLFHPVEQELTVVEKSETHPEGLTLHFRPYSRVQAALERHGFGPPSFRPFAIPIDLPRPERPGDITSHTVRTEDGGRLVFRGALHTPWCHLVAERR
jgi:SAM-dependent methyltransferase